MKLDYYPCIGMLGLALTVAAVPLWNQLSLVGECRVRVEWALAARAAGTQCDSGHEMKLQAALGASLILIRPGTPEVRTAFIRALELAKALDNYDYRLRSLYGLWFFHVDGGRFAALWSCRERFRALAATRPDTNDRLMGERMIGTTLHFLGDQVSARRHLERVLAQYVGSDGRSYFIRFPFGMMVLAWGYFARILWLLGFPDHAVRMAERAIAEARAIDHPSAFCHALAMTAFHRPARSRTGQSYHLVTS